MTKENATSELNNIAEQIQGSIPQFIESTMRDPKYLYLSTYWKRVFSIALGVEENEVGEAKICGMEIIFVEELTKDEFLLTIEPYKA